MPLHIHSKDLKELLRTFTKLSKLSSNEIAPISFGFDPFRVVMMTEHAYVISRPNVSVIPPITSYTFNPEILMDLALTEGDVEFFWENETSVMAMKNNHLRTALRVAVPEPEYIDIPDTMSSIEVPIGLLYAVEQFIKVPYIFFSAKKELTPIWFRKNEKGNLEISADDNCSIARISTNIPVRLKSLDIKIPRYVIETLFAKGDFNDKTPIRIGIHGTKILISNKITSIYISSMRDEEMESFDTFMQDFKSVVSCDFVPKKISEAIKPLISIIPKKDKGSILAVVLDTKNMSMNILHQDIGEGVIDFVDGISDIYLENSAKQVTLNMVPQIFQEHTDLISSLPQASMFASHKVVYYRSSCSIGECETELEYIFPTAC